MVVILQIEVPARIDGALRRVVEDGAERSCGHILCPRPVHSLQGKLTVGELRKHLMKLISVPVFRNAVVSAWAVEFLVIEAVAAMAVVIGSREKHRQATFELMAVSDTRAVGAVTGDRS